MSAMLNFKQGLFKNLQNAPISNGTIYVTTDEKAMYVDLNGSRIRLSQLITLPDVETWQGLTPPYSEEAFYYITKANALLKYAGAEAGWIQINSTADIDSALSALGFKGAVSALPSTGAVDGEIYTVDGKNYVYDSDAEDSKWIEIGAVGTEIIDLKANVASLNTQLTGIGTRVSDLEIKMPVAEADIDNLKKVVGFIGKKEALPEAGVIGDVCIVGDVVYTCVSVSEGKATWEAEGDLSDRIEALKTKIGVVSTELAGVKTTAESAAAVAATALADAGTAQGRADAAYGLAETKATLEDVAGVGYAKSSDVANTYATKEALEAVSGVANSASQQAGTNANVIASMTAGATITTFKGIEDAIAGLSVGDIDGLDAYATDAELDAAKKAILGEGHTGTVKEALGAAQGAQQTANDASSVATNALGQAQTANADIATILKDSEYKTFKDVEKDIAEIEDTISKLNDTFATDSELTDAKKAVLGVEADGTIYTGTVKDNAAAITGLRGTVEGLENTIESKMQAADAMQYKGTVKAASELPTEKVENGFTYKAVEEFTLEQGSGEEATITQVYVGDLLVARGAEDENGHIGSDLIWDHVPSGYQADYNPELGVAGVSNSAVISLTSAHESSLGSVTLNAAENSAVVITTEAEASAISIGMAWGSF